MIQAIQTYKSLFYVWSLNVPEKDYLTGFAYSGFSADAQTHLLSIEVTVRRVLKSKQRFSEGLLIHLSFLKRLRARLPHDERAIRWETLTY